MPEELEERLSTLKREVDALQIAVLGTRTPWYRNISTLISVTALLFSFGTTFVSYKRAEIQDIQSKQQELRSLLQRLAALPKENQEIFLKYQSDPASMSIVSGWITQENTMLSRQAAELAHRLPPNSVTSTEYYGVAMALGNSNELQAEKEFLQLAEDNAVEMNTEGNILRTAGWVQFQTGHPELGRVEYQKALGIFSKYKDYDAFTIAVTNALTELHWSAAENSIGQRQNAARHLKEAERIAAGLPPGQGTDFMNKLVQQAKLGHQRLIGAPIEGTSPEILPPK